MGFSVAGAQGPELGGAAPESGDIDEYQVDPWRAAGEEQRQDLLPLLALSILIVQVTVAGRKNKVESHC